MEFLFDRDCLTENNNNNDENEQQQNQMNFGSTQQTDFNPNQTSNNKNNGQQRHSSSSSSSATTPHITVELQFLGLPNRPVAGSMLKSMTRLPLEMEPGIPSYKEDLEQIVRAKLLELRCIDRKQGASAFDLAQPDGWIVDDELFNSTRDKYSQGKVPKTQVWVIQVQLSSPSSSTTNSATPAPYLGFQQQQQQQQNHHQLSPPQNDSSSGGLAGLTAAALQQHNTNTYEQYKQQQQQQNNNNQSNNQQQQNQKITRTNTGFGAFGANSNNSSNVTSQARMNIVGVAQPTAASVAPQIVSIVALKNGLSYFPRGSWTIVATVVEIRHKTESITDLLLCQPDLDPRAMISAVCFNDAVSRRLREQVFKHCEIQLERAQLSAKSDTDRKFQREEHPYKIVLDGNCSLSVLRNANDNVAQVALLHAAAVVTKTASAGSLGAQNFQQQQQRRTLFMNQQHMPSSSAASSSTMEIIQNATATARSTSAFVPGFVSADPTSVAIDQARRFQTSAAAAATASAISFNHQGNNNSGSTSSLSGGSSGGSLSNQSLSQHQQQQTGRPSSSSSSHQTRTKFMSTLQGQQSLQQQNQNQNNRTQQELHPQQQQQGIPRTLCGAPVPTRKDIESRDGVMALQSAVQEIEESSKNNATSSSSRLVSSSTSNNNNNSNDKVSRVQVPECYFCGIDSSDSESIQTKLFPRLEKIYKRTEAISRKMSLEKFLPSEKEVSELLGEQRKFFRNKSNNSHHSNNNKVSSSSSSKEQKEFCLTRVVDPLTRKSYRLHPRCVHLCTDYQNLDSSARLADCSPRLECRMCELCGEEGATTKCCDPSCNRFYHSVCCVFSRGVIDFGQYDPYHPCAACPAHAYDVAEGRSGKNRKKKKRSKDKRKEKKDKKKNKTKRRNREGGKNIVDVDEDEDENDSSSSSSNSSDDDEDDEYDDEGNLLFDAKLIRKDVLRDPDDYQ